MQIRLSRNLLCFWMIFPLFILILQFCFKVNFSECSMCFTLHPNTSMLFGCRGDGYFFPLCHSLHSGAKTEQCVCNSCRAVTYKPAEQVWKAWLALRNEAAPPTSSPPQTFLYLPYSRSGQQVSTDLVSGLLSLLLMWKLRTEQVATFTCSLVCKQHCSLSGGIHTSCFFLNRNQTQSSVPM